MFIDTNHPSLRFVRVALSCTIFVDDPDTDPVVYERTRTMPRDRLLCQFELEPGYRTIWSARSGIMLMACRIDDSVMAAHGSEASTFEIHAQRGTMIPDGSYAQTGNVGDWVLRSPYNADDMWIVPNSQFVGEYHVVK